MFYLCSEHPINTIHLPSLQTFTHNQSRLLVWQVPDIPANQSTCSSSTVCQRTLCKYNSAVGISCLKEYWIISLHRQRIRSIHWECEEICRVWGWEKPKQKEEMFRWCMTDISWASAWQRWTTSSMFKCRSPRWCRDFPTSTVWSLSPQWCRELPTSTDWPFGPRRCRNFPTSTDWPLGPAAR